MSTRQKWLSAAVIGVAVIAGCTGSGSGGIGAVSCGIGGETHPDPVILISTAPHTEVTFDARVPGQADGDIASYQWSFGDGNSGHGKTATHSYQNAGTYSVTLTVTDTQQRKGTTTQTVLVK